MLTTAERYGYEHRKLRAQWRPRVEAGQVACACGCGWRIEPGQPWDLGHDPADSRRYLGPMLAAHNRNTALERKLAGRRRRGFHYRSPAW
jgi:hypothetical protein